MGFGMLAALEALCKDSEATAERVVERESQEEIGWDGMGEWRA